MWGTYKIIMEHSVLGENAPIIESKFITFVDNVYIQICLAITMKEIERVKHFVTDSIYQQLECQLQELNDRKLIHMFDELTVKQTTLLSFEENDEAYKINVHITSLYLDYYLNESGDYVSGNRESRIQKENNCVFCKRKDTKEENIVHRCPGCGKAIDVNGNGMCDYCGSVYDLVHTGWLLTSWEVL